MRSSSNRIEAMDGDGNVDHVWSLMESMRFCMLTTWDGHLLRSRPMGAFVRRDERAVFFFTDAHAHKDEQIRQFPQVCLAFADPHGQKYVSVSGTAQISADRDKIRELWSVPPKLWWGNPDDPQIRLIRVTPVAAEYWDAPGNMISNLKAAFEDVTGAKLSPGEHRKVAP